jgi:hypothetical protein
MFCADEDQPCEDVKFIPRNHSFRGSIKILVNEECISSCDGFTWMMKTHANARLYGFYQAADTAFSRLRVDAITDNTTPEGFRIEINPHNADLSEQLIAGQIVAASLSTDSTGNILSGKPLPPDVLIPYRQNQYYPRAVFRAAIQDQ